MKLRLLPVSASLALLALGSCADEPQRKAVPPTTETSKIPWNRPVAGQGQGQFGMLPQNQYRR